MERVIKRYEILNGRFEDICIGVLYEDYTQFPMRMHIEVTRDIISPVLPLSYKPLMDENRVIDHKGVEFWISCRVMPPTQDGCDEKLRQLGLSEYSALALFHLFNGESNRDSLYIREV